ncbi:MAG: hypothetical protein QN122_13485 [Armatimonadota bacterium]|nr:hypothetical protein [Armatimonadota bacterium]
MERVERLVPPRIQNPERRLVAEYAATKLAAYVVFMNMPLGPGLEEERFTPRRAQTARALRGWRPAVDALAILAPPAEIRLEHQGRLLVVAAAPPGATVLLIEGKILEMLDGMAKLPFYAKLVPKTPELQGLADATIRMRLVTPRPRPWLEPVAAEFGIELDYFEPEWIRDYWDWRDGYWSREYRIQREEILRARRRLGLG